MKEVKKTRKQLKPNKIRMMIVVFSLLAILVSISSVSAASTVYVNTTGNDSNSGTIDSPYLTIDKGVQSIEEKGTINIANGVYSGTGNANITISKNMTIKGQSQTGTIIDGTGTNWIFYIPSDVTVTIQNLTLTNGTIDYDYGGAIYNEGTLTVNECTFIGNAAEEGGAIYQYDGTTTITDCTFIGNAAEEGGAIYQYDGTTTIRDCTFIGNAAEEGGAIFIDSDTTTTIADSTFIGNSAVFGGAISNPYGYDVSFKLTSSTIKDNTAVEETEEESNYGGLGGGLYLAPGYDYSYEIIGNHIINNVGSGIYIQKYGNLGLLSVSEGFDELLINFNRIYGNTPYGVCYNSTVPEFALFAVNSAPSSPIVDAKYNWWGSNDGPNSVGADKTNLESTYYDPWIVMKLNPTNEVINGGTTTELTANFFYDNLRIYHDPANGHIPDGTPVTFTTTLGQVGSQTITKYTVNSIANAILRAWNAVVDPVSGIAFITATTDAQTLSSSVNILEVPTENTASNTNTPNPTSSVNAASNTITMQNTGVPINYLILAILAVISGFLVPKRK